VDKDIIILGRRGVKDIDLTVASRDMGFTDYFADGVLANPPFTIPYHHRYIHDTSGVEYRSPKRNEGIAVSTGISADWHQDGSLESGAVILWSNRYPTEFKLSDGSIFIPRDREFVLFNNKTVHHRVNQKRRFMGSTANPQPRHFIRAILTGTPSDEQIEQWKRELALP